ncbi:MAG: outer membrane beta-barrel protein [Ferruginibacter sp.]
MKKLFTTLVFASLGLSSFAQNAGTISGVIKDGGNQKIIDAANISLLKTKDSSLVKVSVTDKDGNFSFENVKDGNYIVAASSIGHTKAYSKPLTINAENKSASTGMLQLIPVNKNLTEVVVTAKKQFIERKIDKTILNVDASITNAGSTALEVLEKAPGVSVDKDGNISLKGKQGVIIMMDGKPSYISGADLVNFLRNLPASNLDQIEIMTNPSAKYDASGNSGIINIKTKKNKQKGFNGSLSTTYGQGVYAKTNNSLNLNYKVGKVNIFSTLSANYRKGFQQLDINRKYSNPDKSIKAIFDQNTNSQRKNYNYNSKVGLDFYASKKTTLGIVLTGYSTPGMETGSSTSYLQNNNGIVDSIVTADRIENSKWKNGAVNLNLRHTYDSTGREISADIDFLQYKSDKNQFFDNGIFNPDWGKKYNDVLAGELPSNIKIYSAKVDYTQPLKKGLKLETGFKSSYVTSDNNANYFNVVNDIKNIDWDKTNHFIYKENINAGYVNFSKTIKKWGLQAGLRAENTNNQGNQFGNPDQLLHPDSSFKKSYTNLFPTTYISYNANDKNQYGFSYGRRINRPDYEDLNPFLFFLDKFTYGAGNPFLKPTYAHVFEASHTYSQIFTTTLNYSHTKDLFNETFEQKGFATIVRQGNFGKVNNLSLSFNAQFNVAKWWKAMVYTEGRYQEFKGILSNENLNIHGTNYTANINNQFSFKKGWSAELSGFYRTKAIEGQILIHHLGQITSGVKKDVLKGKGSLKLTIRDMFGPMLVKGNINFQNTQASFSQYSDNRVASLTFNYRFGKPIKGLKNRKSGGADDEKNRVKSAN